MAQLLIRNLEDNVVEALKKRAAAEGKSLEQSLRDLLRDACQVVKQFRGIILHHFNLGMF